MIFVMILPDRRLFIADLVPFDMDEWVAERDEEPTLQKVGFKANSLTGPTFWTVGGAVKREVWN